MTAEANATRRKGASVRLRARKSSDPQAKVRRAELREELYERVGLGTISLPDAVRMMRKIAGTTQIEYARSVGISARVLIELERGIGNPTLKTLEKILAPFGLEVGVRRKPRD